MGGCRGRTSVSLASGSATQQMPQPTMHVKQLTYSRNSHKNKGAVSTLASTHGVTQCDGHPTSVIIPKN